MSTEKTAEEIVAKFDLSSILRTEPEAAKLRAWVPWKHGIKLQINYLSRSAFTSLVRECTKKEWDNEIAARVEKTDQDLLMRRFAKIAVSDWDGVTPEVLAKIVPVKLDSLSEEARKAKIPFDPETFATIVTRARDLDTFLNTSTPDLTLFNTDLDDETKNS